MRFEHHYTLEEAHGLLPRVRQWLARLREERTQLHSFENRLESIMAPGVDAGGSVVNGWVKVLATVRELLMEFEDREIQIKDLDRGLIDFPALREGREVFLCWEDGEDDIEFWHDLDSGYAGRERL